MAFPVGPYAAFSNIKEGSSLGSCYTAHIKNYFKDIFFCQKNGGGSNSWYLFTFITDLWIEFLRL